MNCNDDDLNAKLYSNRATVHFYLGKDVSLPDSYLVLYCPVVLKMIEVIFFYRELS